MVAPAAEIDESILAENYPFKRVFTESDITSSFSPRGRTAWRGGSRVFAS